MIKFYMYVYIYIFKNVFKKKNKKINVSEQGLLQVFIFYYLEKEKFLLKKPAFIDCRNVTKIKIYIEKF